MRKPGYAAALLVVILQSCSTDARERLKHFFFEVPAEPVATTASAGSTASGDAAVLPELPQPAARFASIHSPYAERQCDVCHKADNRMRVVAEQRDSCGDCHEDYFDADLVKHDPVSSGDCAMCHVAHRSPHRALLIKPVFETCVDCHDAEDLSAETHGAGDVTNCVACHDAHFGGEHLLKKDYSPKVPPAVAP